MAPKNCIFCQIVAGDLPSHQVFADQYAVAFLDQTPLFVGHTLLVPRNHHKALGDLPSDQLEPLFARAQRLALIMESQLGAGGTFVAMNNTISQSVPHLHVHVVPRNRKDGLRGFFWPRTKYESEQHAAATAAELAQAYAELPPL